MTGSAARGSEAPSILPSGNDPAELAEIRRLGFNWAAFLMPYFWLMGHGRLTWGMILTVSAGLPLISFAHIVAYPVVAIYLGKRGWELAWTHAPYRSVEDMLHREKEWVLWGVVFKVLFWILSLATLIYLLWILRQPQFLELYDTLHRP